MSMAVKIWMATMAGLGIGCWLNTRKKVVCHKDMPLLSHETPDMSSEDSFYPGGLVSKPAPTTSLQQDLATWGTREGVIEVSNLSGGRRKRKKQPGELAKAGNTLQKQFLEAKKKELAAKGKKVTSHAAFVKSLSEAEEKTQITITNTSDRERPLVLWETAAGTPVSPPLPGDAEELTLQKEIRLPGIHPQGMVYNPVNKLVYIANQLSDSLTVLNADGDIISMIPLGKGVFPGIKSPVQLAVNTHPQSKGYGHIYVCCSVSGTVCVVDQSLQVTCEFAAGIRPVAIAYHPVNEKIWIADLAGDTALVINADTFTLEATLPVGSEPMGLGINTTNGDTWVSCVKSHSAHIFNSKHECIATINQVAKRPVAMAYHPGIDYMYVVSADSKQVIPFNATQHTRKRPFQVGKDPHSIAFHPYDQSIYVVNRTDNTMSVIIPGLGIKTISGLGACFNGLAPDTDTGQVFTGNTWPARCNISGYNRHSKSILLDDQYHEKAKEFQYNPVRIKHARFILSGTERFEILTLRRHTTTGTTKEQSLPFSAYRHPGNFLNVSEVTGLSGFLLDGKSGWRFMIAPHQSITIMLYYHQMKRYHLLCKQAARATGVTMSKGSSQETKDKLLSNTTIKV